MLKVRHQKSLLVLTGIVTGTFLFIKCTDHPPAPKKPTPGTQYAQFTGAQTCADCHKDIYTAHVHTTHFHTSEPANEKSIKGSFTEGKNQFAYTPQEYVATEKHNGLLYQVQYFQGRQIKAEPFDITTGSGKRGQTYLHWKNNRLFQLPLTWFTSRDQWTNSPGYSNRVAFNRPITSRCLECHSTYFQKTSDDSAQADEFSRTNIIYGVDCEKCHGPGAQHVAFQQQNPTEKTGKFILNPHSFNRQQSLDMCRLCHGGRLTKTAPSFSFQPGDTLSNFFTTGNAPPDPNAIDVHGNQYGMLSASKCFQRSQMTCLSCHSPHNNEENMKQVFSQHCMTCHTREHNNFCKLKDKEKYNITANCIDCHMPEQSSRAIMVLLQGENIPTPATMRTHYITVYPEETKKYLAERHK